MQLSTTFLKMISSPDIYQREWEFIYNNFRNLRSTENNNKRKILQEITNTPPTINNQLVQNKIEENQKQKTIFDKKGNYFSSPDALI